MARGAADRSPRLAQSPTQRMAAGERVGDGQRERRDSGVHGPAKALAAGAQKPGDQPRPAGAERQAAERSGNHPAGDERQARSREQQPTPLSRTRIATLATERDDRVHKARQAPRDTGAAREQAAAEEIASGEGGGDAGKGGEA